MLSSEAHSLLNLERTQFRKIQLNEAFGRILSAITLEQHPVVANQGASKRVMNTVAAQLHLLMNFQRLACKSSGGQPRVAHL